jgi:Protein of unknown function (DUF3606)
MAKDKPLVVHIDDPWDVARWCKQWGCTQDELKAAVKATGSVIASTVEAYLKSRGQKRA